MADTPAAPHRHRIPRWLRRAAAAVALAATAAGLIGAIGAYVFLSSSQGIAFMLREVAARSGGALVFEDVTGSLLDTVHVRRIAWRGASAHFVAQDVDLVWSASALWSRSVVIRSLDARTIELDVEPSSGDLPLPQSLALPIEIAVERLAIGRLDWRIGPNGGTLTEFGLRYAGGEAGHQLTRLALHGEAWKLTGEASIASAAPFAIRSNLALAGSASYAGAASQLRLAGTLAELTVDGQGKLNGTSFALSASLAPLAAVPLRSVSLDLADLDLQAWSDTLPTTRLGAVIRAQPAGTGLTGSIEARNDEPGPLDANRLPVRSLATRYTWRDGQLELADLDARLAGPGRATGQARIPLGGESGGTGAGGAAKGAGRWTLAVTDVDLAALHSALAPTRLGGSVQADLGHAQQAIGAKLTDRAMAGGIGLEVSAVVSSGSVALERLQVTAGPGVLEARGRAALGGERGFEFTGTARQVDPARFGAFPAGALDARFGLTGAIPRRGPWWTEIDLAVGAGSRLRGVAVAGTARARVSPGRLQDLSVQATLASGRFALSGSAGANDNDLALDFQLPRLADLHPLWPAGPLRTLAGGLTGRGEWHGPLDRGALALRAAGTSLAVGADVSAQALELDLSLAAADVSGVPDRFGRRSVHLDARASGLVSPQGSFDQATLRLDGTLARHQIALELRAKDVALSAGAQGGLRTEPADGSDDPNAPGVQAKGTSSRPAPRNSPPGPRWTWSGTLDSLVGHGPLEVRLAAPMSIDLQPDRARLGAARFAMTDGTLDLASFTWDEGRIATRGHFAAVPLATLTRLAGAPLRNVSSLTVGGEWAVEASPRLNGSLSLHRDGGDLFLDDGDRDQAPARHALGVSVLELGVRLVDDRATGHARLVASDAATASADFTIEPPADAPPGQIRSDARVSATARADLPTLRLLRPWIGTTAVVNGRVHAEATASGTLAQPNLAAALTADALAVDAPQYGVNLKDGRLRAHLGDGALVLDELVLAGGTGQFRAAGKAALDANGGASTAQITWQANQFRLFNRPDYRLVLDGDGTLALQQRKIALSGNVKVLEGNIAYETAPGATLGRDVVVKDWPRAAPSPLQATDLPLVIDLNIDLGNRLHFAGEGLDTRLRGTIRVTTGARGFLGKGTIRAINGTYRAFGQKLDIDPGRLVFDGPLDNPALDIIALRKNLAVEAGVQVTGTVRVPVIQLTSNPPVNDSEKLAWLILGHGLDRTSGTDLSAVQTAAALLMRRNGKSINTVLAETVGVDDISFKSSASSAGPGGGADLQSGVVAIGKRLNNRLSLIYEQGLTVANSALRIEYALTRNIRLSASTGLVSGIGIQYRKSFD